MSMYITSDQNGSRMGFEMKKAGNGMYYAKERQESDASSGICNGQWHTATMQVTDGKLSILLDGRSVIGPIEAPGHFAAEAFTIGGMNLYRFQSGWVFNGRIRNVKLTKYEHHEVAEIPTVNPEEGSYEGTQKIELSSKTSQATVYYTITTDGTEPADPTSENWTEYTEPISATTGEGQNSKTGRWQ